MQLIGETSWGTFFYSDAQAWNGDTTQSKTVETNPVRLFRGVVAGSWTDQAISPCRYLFIQHFGARDEWSVDLTHQNYLLPLSLQKTPITGLFKRSKTELVDGGDGCWSPPEPDVCLMPAATQRSNRRKSTSDRHHHLVLLKCRWWMGRSVHMVGWSCHGVWWHAQTIVPSPSPSSQLYKTRLAGVKKNNSDTNFYHSHKGFAFTKPSTYKRRLQLQK